jgi:hypothetical protein
MGVVDCDPYYKYSVLYHLEGLPPVCLLHGVDDPHGQASGQASYRRSPRACNWRSVAWQMFQDSLDCLRRALEEEREVPQ